MTVNRDWISLAILIISSLTAPRASAEDFGAAANGLWSNPATWTPAGGPPSVGDNVYIGTGFPPPAIAPAAVELDSDVSVGFLNIGNGSLDLDGHTLTANALLMDSSDGTASIAKSGGDTDLGLILLFGGSSFSVNASDELAFSATVDGAGSMLNINRPLTLSDGVAVVDGGGLTSSDSLELLGFGMQVAGGTVSAGGNITANSSFYGVGITASGVLNLNGNTLTAGILYMGAGTYQVIGGSATLNRGTGGSVQLGSIDVNSGNSFVLEASDSLSGNIRVADAGSVFALNRNTTISGPVTVLDQGTLNVNGRILSTSESVTLSTGGLLTGDGELQAPLSNPSGVVSPGAAAGILSVGEGFSQLANGSLLVELGGTDNTNPSIPEFDQLMVNGIAAIGGHLQVSLISAFTPALGDEFPIISASGGVQSTFADESLPDLAGGLKWQVDRSDPQVYLLRVVSEQVGDYNRNGFVDAADYTIWRDSLGRIGVGLAADGNQNGQVDAQDYELWKQNFGSVIGSGSGSSLSAGAVPEPNALIVALLGSVTFVWDAATRIRTKSCRQYLSHQ